MRKGVSFGTGFGLFQVAHGFRKSPQSTGTPWELLSDTLESGVVIGINTTIKTTRPKVLLQLSVAWLYSLLVIS